MCIMQILREMVIFTMQVYYILEIKIYIQYISKLKLIL